MNKGQVRVIGIALSLTYGTMASATNIEPNDDQMSLLEQFNKQTEIATKTKLNIEYVPGVVDVLYGSTLRKRGYETVLDALTRLPGFQTLTNSYKTNPNIRGNVSDTFQGDIQILLNGVPQVSGNDLQPFMVLDMPIGAIDRIEVIKGPGSALYGEYALNGVINIVTVSEAEGGSAYAESGSFNTHSLSVSQRLQGEDWYASISAMSRRTDGPRHFVETDLLREGSQLLATKTPGEADTRNHFDSVIFQAKYKETQIDASFMSALQGNQFGHFEWISGNEEYQDELSGQAVQISHNFKKVAAGDIKLFAGVQRYNFDRRIQAVPAGFVHPKGPTSNGLSILFGGQPIPFPQDYYLDLESTVQRGYGRVQWLSDFSDTHRILAEAIVQHIDVPKTRDTTNFDIATFETFSILSPNPSFPYYPQPLSSERNPQNTWSLFGTEKESYSIVLQDEIKVSDRTRVTAGVRWDDFERGDDIYSPRLALAHQFSESKLLKFQVARGFRPPSLHQEVSSQNTVDYERMNTLDAQFTHKYDSWAFNHVAYVSWVKNKIIPAWAFDGNLLADRPTYANSHEQYRYYGFENTLRYQMLDSLRFETNIAYARGDGPRLQRSEYFVSPVTVDFNATWDMTESVQWFLEHRYWGPRKRRPDDTRSDLGSQFMTNLSVSISPLSDDRLSVTLASENIFDEDVRVPAAWGFPTSYPNDYPHKPRRVSIAAEYLW